MTPAPTPGAEVRPPRAITVSLRGRLDFVPLEQVVPDRVELFGGVAVEDVLHRGFAVGSGEGGHAAAAFDALGVADPSRVVVVTEAGGDVGEVGGGGLE